MHVEELRKEIVIKLTEAMRVKGIARTKLSFELADRFNPKGIPRNERAFNRRLSHGMAQTHYTVNLARLLRQTGYPPNIHASINEEDLQVLADTFEHLEVSKGDSLCVRLNQYSNGKFQYYQQPENSLDYAML
ncbi:MAG: hypothetical protein AABX11_05380 [Nanoarchaeota archaeon]